MRTRSSLERLATAGRPLFAAAESLVDGADQERILARIVASDRSVGRRRRPFALVLIAAAVIGAAVAAVVTHGHAAPSPRAHGGHGHVALTGPRIQLAGYHFRTPAGFTASKEGCISAPAAGEPRPAVDGFASAAAADGACVEAAYIVAGDWLQDHDPIPDSAAAVEIGQYDGYYVASQGASGESSLYVNLPHADAERVVYLLLVARDVPKDELLAIAGSGLPTLPPPGPVTTTG